VRITADTNILVRVITGDDARESRLAEAQLADADLVALPLTMLCELVWVLARGYKISFAEIAVAISRLVNAANVAVDRRAVAAGLAMLQAGGDFADGVIAHEGIGLGGDIFVSFDRRAVRALTAHGRAAQVPG
jgi:predicted nucleic-acid-binding protein